MRFKDEKVIENLSKSNNMRNQMKLWTTFYRANIHRFAEHYMGIELFLFQKILIYFMNMNTYVMIVAARGLSKSYIISVFAVARCILYPNTKVVIASGQKKQSKLIITEKIEKELMQFPNIAREIKQIKSSSNDASVIFWNGSTIEAVTSSEGSRGFRCNILILEEFRMISKNILETVLKPFLNVYRQPPYLKKPEYAHLTEENIELYISSAWYESHWMWKAMHSARDKMMDGLDTKLFSLDYLTSIHHGLLSKKRVEEDRKSSDFDETAFSLEYENLMYGQNENALFDLEDVNKNRKVKNVLYPIDNVDYEELKNKRKEKLKDGEIRILGVDVALMGGKANDLTVITCLRLIPSGDHYIRKLSYMETIEGGVSEDQSIRIKQLFEDFQCSYVALDTMGNSLAIYDELIKVQYDEERGIEYDAWCAYNDDEMRSRCKYPSALPVVFSIKGHSRLNHEIASHLRVSFRNSNLEIPINEIDAREIMVDKKFYVNASVENKAKYLRPYLQSTMLVNELVNLDHEIVGGFIKVKEKNGKRKDRYSSLAYANYLAKTLEVDNLQETKDTWDLNRTYVLT